MREDLKYLLDVCRASAASFQGTEVLAKCRAAAEQKGRGRVRTTQHSRDRMRERGVKWLDLKIALETATAAQWQDEHGTWKVTGGTDVQGDPLTTAMVVVCESEDVYLWTLFEE